MPPLPRPNDDAIVLRPCKAICHHRHEDRPQLVALAQSLQCPGDCPVIELLPEAVSRARAHLGRDRRRAIGLLYLDSLQMTLAAMHGFDESVGNQLPRRFTERKPRDRPWRSTLEPAAASCLRIHFGLLSGRRERD